MSLLARLNLFWLGAGGFLALFCANEIIANRIAHAPLWLGGRPVLVACYVGLAIGLAIMAFLGVEATPEADANDPEPAASDEAPRASAGHPAPSSPDGPQASPDGPTPAGS